MPEAAAGRSDAASVGRSSDTLQRPDTSGVYLAYHREISLAHLGVLLLAELSEFRGIR
jgi:predicted ATPase with chaperone activity